MELLECNFCSSNLVNMVALRVKHDEYANRSVDIKKNYITIKEQQATKIFLRCYACAKVSELVLKNERGCCSIIKIKGGNENEPVNEIIGVQEGGRFS